MLLSSVRRGFALTLVAALCFSALQAPALAAAPANDARSGAIAAPALPYTHSQSIEEATTESTDPTWCFSEPQRTVWYSYTAQADEVLVATTRGSNFATGIEILEQSGTGEKTVGCTVDWRVARTGAVVAVDVTKGRRYLIIVSHAPYTEATQWDMVFTLREQPKVELRYSPDVATNRHTWESTVTGSVRCSQELTLDLITKVVQEQKNDTLFMTDRSYVECGPQKQLFSVTVGRHRMPLQQGNARVGGRAEVRSEAIRQPIPRQSARVTACTLIGTVGDDTLQGTSGADRICGLQGADSILAGGGDDVIYAGGGADTVKAGGGRDRVYGGAGPDHLSGGPGSDALAGGSGQDSCGGGGGRDTVRGCESLH